MGAPGAAGRFQPGRQDGAPQGGRVEEECEAEY
jgi:hypothetical protein